MKYRKSSYEYRCKGLLPVLTQARGAGLHRVDDILAFIRPRVLSRWNRTRLYRAMVRLRELGLDPGPDSLALARHRGGPTKLRKQAATPLSAACDVRKLKSACR